MKNTLFSFKISTFLGGNIEVWGCCFLDICVYLQFMKLPVWLQQPLSSSTHMSHSFRTEGRTASMGKTPICLGSLRKLRQPWLSLAEQKALNCFLGRTLSSLMTFRLHFKVSGQNMDRNNTRFTTYHFKICQRRNKLIFVMIFVWSNEDTSSYSCNLDQLSASRNLFQTEQVRRRHENCCSASVQLWGWIQFWPHWSLLLGKEVKRESPISH